MLVRGGVVRVVVICRSVDMFVWCLGVYQCICVSFFLERLGLTVYVAMSGWSLDMCRMDGGGCGDCGW